MSRVLEHNSLEVPLCVHCLNPRIGQFSAASWSGRCSACGTTTHHQGGTAVLHVEMAPADWVAVSCRVSKASCPMLLGVLGPEVWCYLFIVKLGLGTPTVNSCRVQETRLDLQQCTPDGNRSCMDKPCHYVISLLSSSCCFADIYTHRCRCAWVNHLSRFPPFQGLLGRDMPAL